MRSRLRAYAVAAAALGAAVLLRWLLDPVLGDALPFVTLFGAVAAAVWVGGYRPAALIAIAGYLASSFLFIPPRGQIGFPGPAHVVGMLAFLFTCSLIIASGEAMRVARSRASSRGETLRVTLASIGDAVISTDVAGRVTYLNAVAESLTGWTQQEAAGRPLETVFQIVNEETRQPVENPVARALREGKAVGLANHTILIRKESGELPIDDSAAPIRDEQGKVSGCVLIFRDVTAQRRAAHEKAGELLAARVLASIVESSEDAIISKTLDGIIQSWNAGAERVFGFSASEAVGRHISLVIPPDRLAEEDHIIATLKAGRRIDHFETERVRKDGARIMVSLTVSPIRDDAGVVVGASKIARDVTRQRRADERERQLLADAAAANAKFHAFFEQGALFAGIIDLDGVLIDANRLSCEGCGYARADVVGKPFWEGPWWARSPEIVERIRSATTAAAAGTTFRAELPYHVANGSARLTDLTILPIRDEAGQVLFLAPSGTDITERRRLADDLQSLAASLSETSRRKDEFLAMLAHELRNPLAPISNAVRALRGRRGDDAALGPALGIMERQIGQMARLVDDLLDVSRVTRGKIALRKQAVALATIVDQAVEAVRAQHGAMNHELTVTMPSQPVYLDVDPARLAQVIGNLLNNACKFTDPGGRIRLTVAREDSQAVIRVQDSGIGIAPEQLPYLFEMFTQADTSLERTRDGLGLGLTLVKMLVEMHGGTVSVRSEGLGRGSEFEVRLPARSEPPAPTAAVADAGPPPAPRRRILIVDDNLDGAESLAMLLEDVGHETHTVHDGIEAIAAAERLQPDAVLLDIGLPRMNGYEVCRRIREQPWGEGLMMVALTGWGQEDDRRRSLEAGFDTHLVKPVDHDLLMTLLARGPATR